MRQISEPVSEQGLTFHSIRHTVGCTGNDNQEQIVKKPKTHKKTKANYNTNKLATVKKKYAKKHTQIKPNSKLAELCKNSSYV